MKTYLISARARSRLICCAEPIVKAHAGDRRYLLLGLLLIGAIKIFGWIVIILFSLLVVMVLLARRAVCREQLLKLERDYPVFLITFASSIKCGLDPILALKEMEKLFSVKSPISSGLKVFFLDLKEGKSEQAAIRGFLLNINYPELELFRESFLLARKQGASLSPCLMRIAKTVRNRQSFRRKIRTAVAMQRLSAVGIGLAILTMLTVQIVYSFNVLQAAWENSLGASLLSCSAILILLGFLGMYKINSCEVWE